jgi:hypothetical protein
MEIVVLITLLDYRRKNGIEKPLYDYEKIIFALISTYG